MSPDLLQWIGAATGLCGALLLAMKVPASRYGFVAYAVSNAAWLGYGVLAGVPGMVAMQLGFLVTTVIGVRNWFFPRTEARHVA